MEALGKYKIEAKLGEGAMGCVYKAWHPGFHDYVALKTIQDTRLEGSQLLERFKREGQALAKLKHQNIVQIYDADQAEKIHFIVMEYMNGGSLDRIIEKRDRSPLAKRVGYIVPACHALNYAHRRGLFHRDIKPANIMLQNDGNDEVVKVVDFGIARLVNLSDTQNFSMSQTNMLIGSPAYMAPELLTGTDRANERTDIWALGVTLYELISFVRPFQGKDFDDLRRNIIHAKAKPLRQFAPECPSDLEAVVQRMIDKDVSRRYSTVEDLLIDLEPIAQRLRTETAVSLMHRANDLCEIGELEEAKSVLTEARRYGPANTQLRELLQKVDQELQRRELLPRLHTHLKRARDFVHMEQYQNARNEIACALSLDANFEPARKYLEEIEDEVKKKELVQDKLRLIRLRITEGELTQAEVFLKEIEETGSGNTQSLELRHEIEQEKQHRLKRKRINEIVSRAQVLMAALREDECLALLTQGLQEYPEEAELLRLREIVRSDLAEALRQQERQRGIEEVRALVGKGNFETAQEKAQQLLQKFPNDALVENLKSFVAEEVGKAEAREQNGAIDAGIRTIRRKIRSKKYAFAVAAAEKLISRFPGEAAIRAVHDEAINALQERKKQEIVQNKSREIRQKINKEQYEEAVGETTRTLQQLRPQEEIEVLLRAGDVELRDQRARKEAEERTFSETRRLLANGKTDEALQLAQDAIDTRVFRKNDARVVALMNDIKNCKSAGRERLQATAGKKPAVHEAPEAELKQQPAHPNERATQVASDWGCAVQPDQNDRVTSADAASVECRIEVPMTGVREKQGSHNLPDAAVAPDVDLTKLPPSTGALRTKVRLIGFLAGAVAIASLALLLALRITNETAKKERSAFRQATADENDKSWPEAVTEYQTLAEGHGALAVQAGKEYTRLAALLEKEKDLKQKAEQARTAKSYDQAEILLTQLADLHGDMEEAALKEKNEVAQAAQLEKAALKVKREEPKLARATRPDVKESAEKRAPLNPEVTTQTNPGCELSSSDLPVRLNRADRNSAQGNYDSAEREYLAVLACQPNNEQARIGLERTRKAKSM
jgi:serine/threonine protein kinase